MYGLSPVFVKRCRINMYGLFPVFVKRCLNPMYGRFYLQYLLKDVSTLCMVYLHCLTICRTDYGFCSLLVSALLGVSHVVFVMYLQQLQKYTRKNINLSTTLR